MAKRKLKSSHTLSRSRVLALNPNRRLRPRAALSALSLLSHNNSTSIPVSDFTDISDNRRFVPYASNVSKPLYDRFARRIVPRRIVRFTPYLPRTVARRFPIGERLTVTRHLPAAALVCVRRKQRREVIFARGYAGSAGQRRPRYNSNSTLICR